MVLEFIGADREVTGSCHYLTFGDTHILIDCGMEQGADLYVNQEIPVNPSLIDYVFVTHAHIDHSGLLPLIYNHGFRGTIFATKATTDLCNIMLKDSAHIQEFEIQSDYLGFRHVRSRPYPASFETQPVADGFYDSVCRLSGAGNAGLFSVKRSQKGKAFRRGN